ncbi:hypothetical protein ACFTAO_35730 [Paenibacillus rhizoplanae]
MNLRQKLLFRKLNAVLRVMVSSQVFQSGLPPVLADALVGLEEYLLADIVRLLPTAG